jgi:hypothetical protein
VGHAAPDASHIIPPTIAQATPEQQKYALVLNQQINQHALATNGVEINPRTERLTWVMGSKGGLDFIGAMKQMPGAPAAQLFPKEASYNPTLFYNMARTESLISTAHVL